MSAGYGIGDEELGPRRARGASASATEAWPRRPDADVAGRHRRRPAEASAVATRRGSGDAGAAPAAARRRRAAGIAGGREPCGRRGRRRGAAEQAAEWAASRRPTTHRHGSAAARSRRGASARGGPSGSSETGARGARWSGWRRSWSPVSCSLCASQKSASSRFASFAIGDHGLELGDRARPLLVGDVVLGAAPAASSPAPASRARAARHRQHHHGRDAKSLSSYLPQITRCPAVAMTCIFTTRSRFAISRCTRSSACAISAVAQDASSSTVSRSRMTRATSETPRSWAGHAGTAACRSGACRRGVRSYCQSCRARPRGSRVARPSTTSFERSRCSALPSRSDSIRLRCDRRRVAVTGAVTGVVTATAFGGRLESHRHQHADGHQRERGGHDEHAITTRASIAASAHDVPRGPAAARTSRFGAVPGRASTAASRAIAESSRRMKPDQSPAGGASTAGRDARARRIACRSSSRCRQASQPRRWLLDAGAIDRVDLVVEIQLDVGGVAQLAGVMRRLRSSRARSLSAARRRWTAAWSCRFTVPSARPSALAISDNFNPSWCRIVKTSRCPGGSRAISDSSTSPSWPP